MKKDKDKKFDDSTGDLMPDWMNPANDRKTPFTEEELDGFVEGFISSMGDTEQLRNMIEDDGIDKVRQTLKDTFRKQDGRNLINLDVKGRIQ